MNECPPCPQDLTLTGVTKQYARQPQPVLQGFGMHVAAGERLALWGPAGSGKTTLLRIIAGLEPLPEGEVRLGGQRINELAPRARGVAMVFQHYALYPHMTVYENLAEGLAMARIERGVLDARVREAAAWVGLAGVLDRKPAGLATGQRHRLALGRAMARRPRVLIVDSPFGTLDAAARAALLEELAALQPQLGATLLYSTQDEGEAQRFGQRVIRLG